MLKVTLVLPAALARKAQLDLPEALETLGLPDRPGLLA